MKFEPLEHVEWMHASELDANDYNPNVVFTPELRLLERSILMTGWVQPVLVRKEGLTIIDGFHRWRLSQDSKPLVARYKGKLPVVALPVDRTDAMLLTIRMNRAKGTHIAVAMSKIVRELIDVHGYEPVQIAAEIGATRDEIELLHQDGIFKAKGLDDYKYSPAWYPAEAR
jgi:ParB-like chromosome segregation protein Spo0J